MSLVTEALLMWAIVLLLLLFTLSIDAKPHRITLSNGFGHVLIPDQNPISRFSPMETQPPAAQPEVTVVHRQDLNKRILIALIVASTVLGVLLFFLSCCWVYRQKKLRHSNGKKSQNKMVQLEEAAKEVPPSEVMVKFGSSRMGSRKGSVAIFDYQLLEDATEKFSQKNVLVEGGSGCVYKARFDDKLLAAVKKLDDSAGQDIEKKFDNEVNWLSQIRHQNIIKFLGYCINGKTRFLIYEMMQNGSLETQLHGPTEGSTLTWHLRLKIAVDVARGLEYLHENCNPSLVHRDIQLSSILLDSNFSAKLFNFGLAVPSGAENKDKVVLSGTSAYIAPEYTLDGKLTDKSDVYAFGVVLLELLMGRKLAENKASVESQSLVKWAMPQLSDRTKLPNIVDPVIKDAMDLKHLYQIAAVAVLCVQPEPSYRPLITDVLHSLIPLVPVELGGSLRLTEPRSSSCSKTSSQ